VLIKNGFNDLNDIQRMRDEDFVIMEISLGHKLKILKKVRELKGNISESSALPTEVELLEDKKTICSSRSTIKEGSEGANTEVREKKVIDNKKEYEAKSKKVSSSCQGDSIMILKQDEKKESCWNCYKMIIKGKGYFDSFTNKVILNIKE